jgi:hypothetical protein
MFRFDAFEEDEWREAGLHIRLKYLFAIVCFFHRNFAFLNGQRVGSLRRAFATNSLKT